MLAPYHACRRSITRSVINGLRTAPGRAASRLRIPIPPAFPVLDSCPAPTCQCQDTPEGLEIDREAPLNGTTAAYAEQILISTGKPDWKSRIEDDDDAVLLRQLKSCLTRGGKYTDPFHNVMITNSSIQPSGPSGGADQGAAQPTTSEPSTFSKSDAASLSSSRAASAPGSAFLLPSFRYVPSIPTDNASVDSFIKAFILPTQLNAHHDVLSQPQRDALTRQPALIRQFPGTRPVNEILILVCGHGGRDQRCGIYGPLLTREFEAKLARANIEVPSGAPLLSEEGGGQQQQQQQLRARVATISHVGGHKFAGNVIVYLPPSLKGNALGGKGVWYGRVEPRHVEGIVEETVLGGKVIRELFRGGVDQDGEVLRL